MSMQVYLNQLGQPRRIGEINPANIPGPGEKITLNSSVYSADQYEVTDVKRDVEDETIYVYVNELDF